MTFNLDNFKNKPPIVVIKDDDINGLSFFKKRLEQLFFSNVVIRNSNINGKTAKLIIEISCNFSFEQGMHHLKARIWARLKSDNHPTAKKSTFYNLVVQLQEKNDFPLEVEEFSLLFTNCNIIINKLYKRSIPEKLDTLLTQLATQYIQLTKGLLQVPYEIFIPVFEEDIHRCKGAETLIPFVNATEHKKTDYFDYWALYFDDYEDALMFDVKNGVIIPGELNMLND